LHEVQNGQAKLDFHVYVFTLNSKIFPAVKRFQQPKAFLDRLCREDRDINNNRLSVLVTGRGNHRCLNLEKPLKSMSLRYFPNTALISIIVAIFKAHTLN